MKGRALLLGFGTLVVVFGAVWLAVILDWRATNRVPNGMDIGLWLLALPLAIIVGMVAVRAIIRRAKQRKATPQDADIAPTAATDSSSSPNDPSLAWQVPVLAVALRLPAGDSPAAVIDAARAGQRVDLHPRLKDAEGLPVFAAEVASLDIALIDANLPDAARNWSDARKRVLALAQGLASDMLGEHFGLLRDVARRGKSSRDRAPVPVLQLDWWLPEHWSDADRETARQWLAERLQAQGWSAPELGLSVAPMGAAPAGFKRLDDNIRALHDAALHLPHLLLATDSNIDAATIAEWDAAHRLHSGTRPEGRVPGEGASAILFGVPATSAKNAVAGAKTNSETAAATNATPLTPDYPPAMAHLHRLVAAQRARPVDHSPRLDSATLVELLQQATTRAGLAPDAITHLVSDTGARSSRAAEALNFVGQSLPDSEPSDTLLLLGMSNGDAGAALALGAVAVAAHLTAESQHAGLVFSNHDALLRAALLVSPPAAATDNAAPNLA